MPDQSQPDQLKRLNYFLGEFLVAEDFEQEQFYFRERMRIHNQKLHAPGVLDGLTVVANPGDSSVRVTSGKALDSQGRLILLNEDKELSLADLMADLTSSTTDNTTITLAISYGEVLSDFAKPGDVNTAKRFLEQGVVRLYQEGDVKLEEITVTVLDKKIVSSTPIATAAGAVIGDSRKLVQFIPAQRQYLSRELAQADLERSQACRFDRGPQHLRRSECRFREQGKPWTGHPWL